MKSISYKKFLVAGALLSVPCLYAQDSEIMTDLMMAQDQTSAQDQGVGDETIVENVVNQSDLEAQEAINQEGEVMKNDWKLGDVPTIGINETNRQALVTLLNRLVADEFILYARAINYHWNVRGVHFGDLHELFGKIYASQQETADRLAERVRALGGKSIGTLAEILSQARIKEEMNVIDPQAMVKSLLAGFEQLIQSLRQDIEDSNTKFADSGTSNMLAEIIIAHEKTAWMLRALADSSLSQA